MYIVGYPHIGISSFLAFMALAVCNGGGNFGLGWFNGGAKKSRQWFKAARVDASYDLLCRAYGGQTEPDFAGSCG